MHHAMLKESNTAPSKIHSSSDMSFTHYWSGQLPRWARSQQDMPRSQRDQRTDKMSDGQSQPLMDGDEEEKSTDQYLQDDDRPMMRPFHQRLQSLRSHLTKRVHLPILIGIVLVIAILTVTSILHYSNQQTLTQTNPNHSNNHDENKDTDRPSWLHPSSSSPHNHNSNSNETTTAKTSIMPQPCGTTPSEARARGCHFDVISFCWLPTACHDASLAREYRDTVALEWFLDPAKTQPVSYDDVMTGEYDGLYVNWEYHITHCTAMWKKMHRALMRAGGARGGANDGVLREGGESDENRGEYGGGGDDVVMIDAYIGNYAHTKHCEHMLLAGRDVALDVINTRIAVKYPDCGVVY